MTLQLEALPPMDTAACAALAQPALCSTHHLFVRSGTYTCSGQAQRKARKKRCKEKRSSDGVCLSSNISNPGNRKEKEPEERLLYLTSESFWEGEVLELWLCFKTLTSCNNVSFPQSRGSSTGSCGCHSFRVGRRCRAVESCKAPLSEARDRPTRV